MTSITQCIRRSSSGPANLSSTYRVLTTLSKDYDGQHSMSVEAVRRLPASDLQIIPVRPLLESLPIGLGLPDKPPIPLQ